MAGRRVLGGAQLLLTTENTYLAAVQLLKKLNFLSLSPKKEAKGEEMHEAYITACLYGLSRV